MSVQSLTCSISTITRKALPSCVLVLPFVLLALVGYLAYRDRQKDIENIAIQLRNEITDRIKENIQLYLKTSILVNRTNATVIEQAQYDFLNSGQFSPDDFRKLEKLFSEQIQNFQDVNNSYIGSTEGVFFGVQWQQGSRQEWELITNQLTESKFNLYQLSPSPKVIQSEQRPFDPRNRPWYQDVESRKNKCEPIWSSVYKDASSQEPVVSAVYPICKDNKLIAVLGSDFLFSEFNKFLEDLKNKNLRELEIDSSDKTSIPVEIFLVEKSGKLLTTSEDIQVFTTNGNTKERLQASKSKDKLISQTAQYLEKNLGDFSKIKRRQLEFTRNGEKQFLQITPLDYGPDWLIVVAIPENKVFEKINTNNRNAIWLGSTALVLAVALVMFVFHWRGLKVLAAASRFVPRDFLAFIGKSLIDVELGAQVEKEMTIMFADIRSFTQRSETMETPKENFDFVNDYFGRVSPIIREHGGIVDKYIGDGIMALFPQSAEAALQAAIKMQCEVSNYNLHLENNGKEPIKIGIGLHTGNLMLGTIGEPKRMETTVISDAVNLASRLEGLTKLYGAGILISETLLSKIEAEKYNYRGLGKARVKGRNKPVSVFEVYSAEAQAVKELKDESKKAFEEALILYSQKEFTQAEQIFQRILTKNPQDRAAKMYIERCEYYQMHSVPEGWSGIEDFEIDNKVKPSPQGLMS